MAITLFWFVTYRPVYTLVILQTDTTVTASDIIVMYLVAIVFELHCVYLPSGKVLLLWLSFYLRNVDITIGLYFVDHFHEAEPSTEFAPAHDILLSFM